MKLEYYLILINIISFILSIINIFLHKYTKIKVDLLLNILALIFGTTGIILAIILFNKNNNKENILKIIQVVCLFIIQLIIVIIFKYNIINNISFKFWNLFKRFKYLLIYLETINIITFIIFTLDKLKAILGKWRYKIATLLFLCIIGGGIGGTISMYLFRHKISKDYFKLGVPIIMITQIIILIFINNIYSWRLTSSFILQKKKI